MTKRNFVSKELTRSSIICNYSRVQPYHHTSYIVIAKEYTSQGNRKFSALKSSGAIQCGLPRMADALSLERVLTSALIRDKPKSQRSAFSPSSTRILTPFKSPWMTFFECKWTSAEAICLIYCHHIWVSRSLKRRKDSQALDGHNWDDWWYNHGRYHSQQRAWLWTVCHPRCWRREILRSHQQPSKLRKGNFLRKTWGCRSFDHVCT